MAVTVPDNRSRKSSLDVIRSLAIVCVVLNHVAETVYPLHDLEALSSMKTISVIVSVTSFTIGRIGVPLFLLLTGYLLLTRDFFKAENGISGFYKKNLLPLVLTWEIWIVLYNLIGAALGEFSLSWKHYLSEALFLEPAPFPHSWFIPKIIGIYLFIPFVAKILSMMKGKWILLLMGITLFYSFIATNVHVIFPDLNGLPDISFGGGVYGFYVIFGYCLCRYHEKIRNLLVSGKRKFLMIFITLLLFACTVGYHIMRISSGHNYLVWYDFFTMPFIGAGIFILLNEIEVKGSLKNIFMEISLCAFGIYLIHEPILILLSRILPDMNYYLKLILCTIIVFIVSLLLVSLLGRLFKGKLGKVLFLRKGV